ncbi:Exodeoxyribonuclease III [Candidatus Hepatincolaceae symbiont of Richtersius coronifer]
MQIATWNVNSLKVRLDIVKSWLIANPVDFLLLQEIKGLDEEIFRQFGNYQHYFILQKAYNGVATLSKYKCKIANKIIPDLIDEQSRFLEIIYQDIHLINIYIPNGNPINTPKYDYKLIWLDKLYSYLEKLVEQEKNFIIAGDFNIAPKDKDVYSVEAFKNDALIQKAVKDFYFKLINLGLTDVIDFQYPYTKNIFSWWDYRNSGFARDHGARIDHILISPYLTTYYKNSYIDKLPRQLEQPSDHTPVICELNL